MAIVSRAAGLAPEIPIEGQRIGQPNTTQPAVEQPQAGHVYKGDVQPSIQKRMEHAKNFLADEDYHRCLDFARKLREIEEYVEWLEKTNQHYDRHDHEAITKMIAVHRQWVEKAVEAPANDFSWTWTNMKPPSRLRPWNEVLKFKRLYKDTPHALPRCLRRTKEVGLTLPLLEDDRLTELDPFYFGKKVAEFRERQQILINTFQAMESTAYAGKAAYVRAPSNYNGPYLPIPKILVENGMAQQLHKLLTVLGRLLDAEKKAPRSFLRDVIVQIQRGMCCQPISSEEAQGMNLQLRNITQKAAGGMISAWLDAQQTKHKDPHRESPAQEEGSTLDISPDIHISNADIVFLLILAEESWTSEKDSLSFEGREPGQDPTSPALVNYSELAIFAERLESLFPTDLFPSVDTAVSFSDILLRINNLAQREDQQPGRPDLGGQGLTFGDEAGIYLERMHVVGRVRWHTRTRQVQKPAPNCHPEHRFLPRSYRAPLTPIKLNGKGDVGMPVRQDVSIFLDVALRLGKEMIRLLGHMASNAHPKGEQAPAAAKLALFIETPEVADITKSNLASELLNSDVDQNEHDTAVVLQTAMLQEINMNMDCRATDFEQVWAFAKLKPEDKIFFSLDRWPKILQDGKRVTEIEASGPQPAKPQSTGIVISQGGLEANAKRSRMPKASVRRSRNTSLKEKYYKGDARFEFGENDVQKAWLSYQIDEDLQDVPEFAYIYKPRKGRRRLAADTSVDPLTLPNLGESWTEREPWPAPKKVSKGLDWDHGQPWNVTSKENVAADPTDQLAVDQTLTSSNKRGSDEMDQDTARKSRATRRRRRDGRRIL